MDSILLDPRGRGWPVARRRRYALFCRNDLPSQVRLDALEPLIAATSPLGDATLFATEKAERVSLSPKLQAQRLLYRAKKGDGFLVMDLNQNPLARPRGTTKDGALASLTCSSTRLWVDCKGRYLLGTELLLAQGFPATNWAGQAMCGYDTAHLVEGLSNHAQARLAGNAMHASCVGLLLAWVATQDARMRLDSLDQRCAESGFRLAPVSCADATATPRVGFFPHRFPVCPDKAAAVPDNRTAPAHGNPDVYPVAGPEWHTFPYTTALEAFVHTSQSAVGRSARAPGVPCDPQQRRDLFPLPEVPLSFLEDAPPCVRVQVQLLIAALNVLWGGGSPVPCSNRKPTKAQRRVLEHLIATAAEWLLRMCDSSRAPATPAAAWQSFEDSVAAEPLRLEADKVDLPTSAATCDPYHLLGPELQACWNDPVRILPAERVGHEVHRIASRDRAEYLRLTVRELELGKLVLLRDAQGLGSIFPVKKSGGRQRAVWHGTLVSEASSRPLKPRRLADPSAFLAVDWDAGTRVVWSKRDAASFFDTLQCPVALRPWFGRPPVAAHELLSVWGASGGDLAAWHRDGIGSTSTDGLLYPCSQVWPMGYSWSSAIAQDVSLGLLRHGGFSEDQALCSAHPPPLDQRECLFVLTDDCLLAHVIAGPKNTLLPSRSKAPPTEWASLTRLCSTTGFNASPRRTLLLRTSLRAWAVT